MKYLATPSSIFIFISSSSTGELCSQPIRDKVCQTGWMFPEHVEWSFCSLTNTLNYIHKAKVCPIKNQLYSLNTPNYVREQMFAQLRMGLRKLKVRLGSVLMWGSSRTRSQGLTKSKVRLGSVLMWGSSRTRSQGLTKIESEVGFCTDVGFFKN